MNIRKDSRGKTSTNITENQVITYDPSLRGYMIQTEVGGRTHTSLITSDILDELYNRSWEGEE
jgi:hypothetical protein